MELPGLVTAVERARRAGAAAVELCFEEALGREVVPAPRGKIAARTLAPAARWCCRVWADGRVGEGRGPELDVALAGARSDLRPEGDRGPVERPTPVGGGSIADRRWGRLTDDERAEVVVGAERDLKRADRSLAVVGVRYAEQLRVRRYANSRGVRLEETDTVFGVTVAARAGGGVAVGETLQSRTFASVASIPVGIRLAQRAAALSGPAVRLDGPHRVVLFPPGVAALVAGIAELARSGGGPARLDPRLHVQDDGLLAGGLATRSFDDRGRAPQPLLVVRAGEVARPYREEVGRYVDGAVRPANLILRGGTCSVAATLSELGGDALVLVDALHELAFDGAGAFRARVDGHVRRRGRPVGSLRRTPVSGSLGAVLGEVVELCCDTERVGGIDAPAAILDGFTFGA